MSATGLLVLGLGLGAFGALLLLAVFIGSLFRAASRKPGLASSALADPDPFEWEGRFPSAPDLAWHRTAGLFPCVLVSQSGVEIPIADESEMVEAVRYLGLVNRLASGTSDAV